MSLDPEPGYPPAVAIPGPDLVGCAAGELPGAGPVSADPQLGKAGRRAGALGEIGERAVLEDGHAPPVVYRGSESAGDRVRAGHQQPGEPRDARQPEVQVAGSGLGQGDPRPGERRGMVKRCAQCQRVGSLAVINPQDDVGVLAEAQVALWHGARPRIGMKPSSLIDWLSQYPS